MAGSASPSKADTIIMKLAIIGTGQQPVNHPISAPPCCQKENYSLHWPPSASRCFCPSCTEFYVFVESGNPQISLAALNECKKEIVTAPSELLTIIRPDNHLKQWCKPLNPTV